MVNTLTQEPQAEFVPQQTSNHSALPMIGSARTPAQSLSDRIGLYGMICLLAYEIYRSASYAAIRPLWYDEVLTWAVARQPHIGDIWRALARAADGQPPTFYYIERFFGHFSSNEQIAFRLPSLAAFCGLLVCVFILVRRYSGNLAGLLCSATILISPLHDPYPVEARPYAMVVACIAFALVCYERADSKSWTVALGLSLMLAQALHYYAIFPVMSFGVAELVYALRLRKFRWRVWSAITASIVPMIVCWPLLRNFKTYYGQHFWSTPNSWALFTSYYLMLRPLIPHGVTYGWREIITGVAILGALSFAILLAIRSIRNRIDSQPSFQTLAAISALLAVPFTIFIVTTIGHGGFTERYTLSTVVGMAATLGYALRKRNKVLLAIVAVLVCVCLVKTEADFWRSPKAAAAVLSPNTDDIQRLVLSAGHPELPVVISDSLDALPLSYYAPQVWYRYYEIVDPQRAVKYIGTDSNDKEVLIMRALLPIQTIGFEAFATSHPEFILYSSSSGTWNSDWWPLCLSSEGYTVKTLLREKMHSVYLVELRKRALARN